MLVNKKKLIFSAVIWSVLNAGFVLLFDKLFHNTTGDVIASTCFSLLWVLFAVLFCRSSAQKGPEGK